MSTDNKNSADKPPFLAFTRDETDMQTLKAFAGTHQWADDGVHQGDIATATEYLKSNPSPVLLVVELPGASEAEAALNALADVCDPDTKVLTVGKVNEYSFYCWLMEIGILSYLLKPLTEAALENAYVKSVEPPAAGRPEKPPGKVIAVLGTRGGVGATTITLNMAGIVADLTKKQVALVDVDPQEGSIALTLDIEPSRGMREALEKPDRIDSLFIERVMNKPLKNLSVLSAEESLQERLNIHDHAADILLKELRGKFDFVILDIPRHLNYFSRQCLKQAEHVVVVTDLTLLSLRDSLRLSDMLREAKIKTPVIVANRTGFVPKQEMKIEDFEKGINAKVSYKVAFAPDIFMQVSNDIPSIKQKANAQLKPLYDLVAQLIPEAKPKTGAEPEKKSGMFKFKKDK